MSDAHEPICLHPSRPSLSTYLPNCLSIYIQNKGGKFLEEIVVLRRWRVKQGNLVFWTELIA